MLIQVNHLKIERFKMNKKYEANNMEGSMQMRELV